MLPYKSIIQIDRDKKLPVFLQISQQLTGEIIAGRLAPGAKLPGSRKMADLLGVNRNTIIAAYQELTMQGWLRQGSGSGTFVRKELPANTGQPDVKITIKPDPEHHPKRAEKYTYHFDDGQPDVRKAPLLALTREMSALVKTDYFHRNLNYPEELRGDEKLREQLAEYLGQTRGIKASPDQILVTRGTVNSFHLFLEEKIYEDEVVIVGVPGYKVFTQMAARRSAKVLEVNVDDNGIDVQAIEEICRSRKVSLLYVIPHHHHPTTVKLCADRRLKLIRLAKKNNFTILEDDYDYDFHYEGSPVVPLASHDQLKQVVYVGSFSKLLVPSVRLGFLVGPQQLIDQLAQKRRTVDRCGNPLIERAMANLMETGVIRRSLRKAVRSYRERRDLLCELLQRNLAGCIFFDKPDGGMAVWARFHPKIDLTRLVMDCRSANLFLPLPEEYNTEFRDHLRLGFAMMDENEIRAAFTVLKECVDRQSSSWTREA